MGDADYSYYFVLKSYLPLLQTLGDTRVIDSLDEAFVSACRQELESGNACCLLAFAPPHKIPFGMPCPVIPVFAWEYSSIPNRKFISDPKDSWTYCLEHFRQALTHSSYAKQVVLQDMGADFPIEAVPAPLWDTCAELRSAAASRHAVKHTSITLGTTVIDNRDFHIASESIAPASQIARPLGGSKPEPCNDLDINFGQSNPDVWMVGFYAPEGWGAWSKTTSPWIMLPSVVSGRVRLTIDMNAHGNNINRDIEVRIGDQCVIVQPQVALAQYEFELEVSQPSNFITFSGVDISAKRTIVDPRTIGIGLARVCIENLSRDEAAAVAAPLNVTEHKIALDGVVYTTILNPRDGRKNWEDILTAFCLAFRDHEDVTLILKMTYKDMSGYLEDIFALFCQLHPFKCRIVVVHGYIAFDEYRSLAEATSYIVNASRSEGQCLPLMEYMSSGIPAIAPDNTAMADYICEDNAFVVESSPEPHYWPHDPQQVFTTLWYRPSWESLYNAYRDSYEVAINDPDRYQRMSRCAWESQYQFCSMDKLKPRLESLLKQIRQPAPV
ncbi:MAG: hypothetical protein KDI17_15230 [Halioglobus sp.]|nr:hypothetical protein [Halioglobus sp.]